VASTVVILTVGTLLIAGEHAHKSSLETLCSCVAQQQEAIEMVLVRCLLLCSCTCVQSTASMLLNNVPGYAVKRQLLQLILLQHLQEERIGHTAAYAAGHTIEVSDPMPAATC
jgi:hypothetical protein